MAGWGRQLASWGFAAIVPTWPDSAAPATNARGLLDLLDWLAAQGAPGAPLVGRLATSARGLVGHSLGGEAALLAAEQDPRIAATVALDPVDGVLANPALRGAAGASGLVAILRAQPSLCNLGGSDQTRLYDALPGAKLLVSVRGGSHCDPGDPSNWLCDVVCGARSPARLRTFERYATAALLWGLRGDRRALAFIGARALSADGAVGAFASRLASAASLRARR